MVKDDSRAIACGGVTGGRGRGEGVKRQEILAAATARFGRDGYENTKWADIAGDVGVGPTALYHYFESKQHCLYVIIDQAIEDFRARFDGDHRRRTRIPSRRSLAVLEDCFDLGVRDVQRNRLLVAEQGLLVEPARVAARGAGAPGGARPHPRPRVRVGDASSRTPCSSGAIPARRPAAARPGRCSGLYNSIWHWYRPNGIVRSATRGRVLHRGRILAMIGVPPETKVHGRMVA